MGWFWRFVTSLGTVRSRLTRRVTFVGCTTCLGCTRCRFFRTSFGRIGLAWGCSQPLNFSAETVYFSSRVAEVCGQFGGELVEGAGQVLYYLPCPVRFHWHSLCIRTGLCKCAVTIGSGRQNRSRRFKAIRFPILLCSYRFMIICDNKVTESYR